MKRTKSPALTSPWKIGFLVSLMLVFVSIGVTYYFVHQYAVPLNILERDWLDKSEWLGVIRGEGFLFEMLPLLGLVAVSAMVSYMVITAAVRKYKKYLDSGYDYKNLLSSLKEIEDLEDKKKIERIKNHPELKRLLLGVAESLEEKERLLSEREGGLATRVADALAAREKEIHEDLSRQCGRLSKAIEARTVDPSAIEFANPDLARLSRAVGSALQANAAPAPTDLESSYTEMKHTVGVFQTKLREISDELRLSRETAQGIEQQIRTLAHTEPPRSGGDDTGRASKEVRTVLGSLRELDDLAAAIDLTAEEARGVAINTALRAGSGEGTQDDLIRLAEDVKDVAGRFKDAAKRFFQLSTAMRSSAGSLETLAADSARRGAATAGAENGLAAVLSRVSLWVERIVVLSDRVMNLSETFGVAMTTLPPSRDGAGKTRRTEETAAAEPETVSDTEGTTWIEGTDTEEAAAAVEAEEFGFQTLDRSKSLFAEEMPASEPAVDLVDARDGIGRDEPAEEHDTARAADRADTDMIGLNAGIPAEETPAEETSVDEIPAGRGIFEEMTARPLGSAGDDVVESDRYAPMAAADAVEAAAKAVAAQRTAAAAQATAVAARATATAESEEEIIDLYNLGAVDYDPALHG